MALVQPSSDKTEEAEVEVEVGDVEGEAEVEDEVDGRGIKIPFSTNRYLGGVFVIK